MSTSFIEYSKFSSKEEIIEIVEIVQNNKINKFYIILFGLQTTIILFYYIYNLCV
jgi:hypothetical protein